MVETMQKRIIFSVIEFETNYIFWAKGFFLSRQGIYGQIYPFAFKEFPRAKPEGIPEGEGVYLTV